MTCVAFRAVEGGSVPRIRWIRGLGADPGHWWPAPAMVISSTARPAGQEAVEVVTVPAVIATGTAQWSMARQRALRDGTEGPSMCATPWPSPPWEGILVSAVPWIWMTDSGCGAGQLSSSVAESGPIAAKTEVRQASV